MKQSRTFASRRTVSIGVALGFAVAASVALPAFADDASGSSSHNMRLVGTNDLQARSTYQPTLHKYPRKRYILFAGHHALANQGENLLPGGTRLPSLNPLTGPGRGFRAGLRRPEGLGEEPIAGCQCRCAVQWKSMLF